MVNVQWFESSTFCMFTATSFPGSLPHRLARDKVRNPGNEIVVRVGWGTGGAGWGRSVKNRVGKKARVV